MLPPPHPVPGTEFPVLAHVVAQSASGDAPGFDIFSLLLPLALAFLIFTMFRRQRKTQQQVKEMRTQMEPGTEVMTQFGLFGTIVSIDQENNKAVLELSPGNFATVHTQALSKVVQQDTAAAGDPVDDEDAVHGTTVHGTTVPDDASSISGDITDRTDRSDRTPSAGSTASGATAAGSAAWPGRRDPGGDPGAPEPRRRRGEPRRARSPRPQNEPRELAFRRAPVLSRGLQHQPGARDAPLNKDIHHASYRSRDGSQADTCLAGRIDSTARDPAGSGLLLEHRELEPPPGPRPRGRDADDPRPRVQGGSDITPEQLDQAVEIIRQRVDGSGVAEAEINTQSGQNVIVSLPGTPDPETRDLIQASAQMEFRPVLTGGPGQAAAAETPTPDDQLPQ